MPVYKVKSAAGERIVLAKNQATAINHVIRPGVTAESLTADDVAKIAAAGTKIETAEDEKDAA